MSYQGKDYGIALGTDARMIFVRKDLFEKAGLDPDSWQPTSWAERARRRPRDQEGGAGELPAAAQRRRQHGRGDHHAGLLDGAARHRRGGDGRQRQVDRFEPGHPRHPQALQDDLRRRGPRRPARAAPRRRAQPHLRQLPRRQDRDAGRGRLVLPLGDGARSRVRRRRPRRGDDLEEDAGGGAGQGHPRPGLRDHLRRDRLGA